MAIFHSFSWKNNNPLCVCVCVCVHVNIYTMPTKARDMREMGSIPGSGRSPGGGHGTHSSILAWRIPWTEEPG